MWVIRSRALRARAGRCGQRYGGLPRGRQELRHSRGSPPGLRHWLPLLHGDARVSRAQVTSMVANTPARETLREALVATYVWGKGKSGSPGGSGPTTLHKILAAEDLPARRLRSLTVADAHQCHPAAGWTHHQMAELARAEGNTHQEQQHYEAAVRAGLACHDGPLTGWSLIQVARCAEHCGDLAQASEHYAGALEVGSRIHDQWMVSKAEKGLARAADPANHDEVES
ncbi:tetratricopeptide repeat protein [Streptomyces sp. NPDC093261]|uniref:tetratricopeptide repeat protein n=1 Tax=Streptomyces sp. NPDC093261 TaxID=3366037 RepID=UPI003830389F